MKKVGQIFKCRGKKLITIESDDCDLCFFYHPYDETCHDQRFSCLPGERKDGKSVLYKLYEFKFGK